MTEPKEQKFLENKPLSAFLSFMKSDLNNDKKNLALARTALRQLKSYSSTWENDQRLPGYQIKIKGGTEERVLQYAFDPAYDTYMEKVTQTVNLNTGRTGFIENTDGFLLNYMSQRGFDAHGLAMNEKDWEKSLLSNFPVYRREHLRKPLVPLATPSHDTPPLDRLIWIVGDGQEEVDFVTELCRKSTITLLVFIPEGSTFPMERFSGHVLAEETLPLFSKTTTRVAKFLHLSLNPPEGLWEEASEIEPEKPATTLPEGLQVLQTHSAIFRVDLSKCRDNNGFLYTEPGHYFVETLRQYEANEHLDYENSYLRQYYKAFQPQNRRDNYLLDREGDIFPLNHGWLYDPWRKPANPPLRKERFETRKGGNHNLGPNTEEFGRAEFKRLVHAYNMLKQHGYHPDYFVDGYITGYLLIRKNDYRFVTSEGQHRIAALAALGYKNIVCRFDMKHWTNETVFYNQAHKWPQVKAGIFSHRVATLCFEHFFRQDNNQRLLEKTIKK